MKKKFIITDSSPPKQAHKSPPKQAHKSSPKQAHKSPPKQAHKSPPKNTRLTNTKFIIEDIILPILRSPTTVANQCCSCRRDRNIRVNTDCVWCQFQNHLDKCVK